MKSNVIWNFYPFPYAVIDNFLADDDFQALMSELDQSKYQLQATFETPLECKSIYKYTQIKGYSEKLISRISSKEIKEVIQKQIGEYKITSLSEVSDLSGYSPYHITNNNGYLGSHVDHSSIQDGFFRHIANTIFYASREWKKDWGGETILFSKNGLIQKEIIEPIPNRLIVFIHTANSFHGVSKYSSDVNVQRRTFYQDYYVQESDVDLAMDNLNINRRPKLKHSFHATTFIPLIPFGVQNIRLDRIFKISNLNYAPTYIVYLFNLYFGTSFTSLRTIFKRIVRKFFKIITLNRKFY